MIKYDKIYVHCHPMQSNLEIVLEPGECGKSVKRVDNVLVMTIEELRECFGWNDLNYGNRIIPEEIFKKYLTSKGITP